MIPADANGTKGIVGGGMGPSWNVDPRPRRGYDVHAVNVIRRSAAARSLPEEPASAKGFLPARSEQLQLDLLKAIAENRTVTQRDLSARLEIALGLTNALLKRLARKGLIKVTHVSPRRVTYLLTPKGILEKSRLTYSYIQFSVGYYRDLRNRLSALFARLVASGARRVVLYGTGEVAEIALICAHGSPLELMVVGEGTSVEATCLARPVTTLEGLRGGPSAALILTVPVPPRRFAERFERLGIPATKVWGLDGDGRDGGGGLHMGTGNGQA